MDWCLSVEGLALEWGEKSGERRLEIGDKLTSENSPQSGILVVLVIYHWWNLEEFLSRAVRLHAHMESLGHGVEARHMY